jgi:hypothetical protein
MQEGVNGAGPGLRDTSDVDRLDAAPARPAPRHRSAPGNRPSVEGRHRSSASHLPAWCPRQPALLRTRDPPARDRSERL